MRSQGTRRAPLIWAIALALGACASAARPTGVVPAWNGSDEEALSRGLAEGLLESAWLAEENAALRRPPVLRVVRVSNATGQELDEAHVRLLVELALGTSGRVEIAGAEADADFVLVGEVARRESSDRRTTIFAGTLRAVVDGRTAWSGEKQLRKQLVAIEP